MASWLRCLEAPRVGETPDLMEEGSETDASNEENEDALGVVLCVEL